MGYLLLFLQGLGGGLAIAAPVGPVGVLCISRTLRHGLWIGMASVATLPVWCWTTPESSKRRSRS